ncbi:hypothetical protein BD410DRAFT_753467 [Rickenella mellea]|uniref:BTB domain-containing protein n=1 Tax=Rickenella mellea TaxID=50990 RepID=A0A4Y7PSZ8_9AGAM|nr:hypothetical protein BD410DRAFT_753467 [Rickenella mellea]
MDSPHGVAEESSVVRHEQYYFSFIVFRIENCLFKLPRHFVEQSEVFQGMCDVAQADTEEGTCDQRPIHLAQTKWKDFEAFLKVALPTTEGGAHNDTTLSCEEWLAVLELAHKYNFKNTRQLAITALNNHPMEEIKKITIIKKYEIEEWASAAYEKLMVRDCSLTHDEMELLGLKLSSKMADAREKFMMLRGAAIMRSGQSQYWYCEYSGCKKGPQNLQQFACPHCNQNRSTLPRTPTDQTAIREVIRVVFGDPVTIL